MDESARHGLRTVIGAVLAFAVLSIAAGACGDGFLDADAATHYLFARYAFHAPVYLVNIWGRPLTTGLYAPAAIFAGRWGVHLISLACAIGCALVAWRLAILQNCRLPALAAIFTLGQPLLFFHSYSEMTELPFAVTTGIAFLAYRKRNWLVLAITASLLPMGRPEGFGFLLLAVIALIAHRQWLCLLIAPVPLVLWSYAGWTLCGGPAPWWHWLIDNWPYASGSDYPPGPLLHFVLLLPMLVSPMAFPGLCIGIYRAFSPSPSSSALSTQHSALAPAHSYRCQILIAVIPLGVLFVHSLAYWLGRLSSNGELRYLLIVAPLWGVLCATGWEWICDRLQWRNAVAWAALGLVAAAQINWRHRLVPEPMADNWESARRLVAWYNSSPIRAQYPRLLFAHPAIEYYLNDMPDDPVRALPWGRRVVAANPPGVLMIWDRDLSARNADPSRDVTVNDLLQAGWKERRVPSGVGPEWRLFLSQRAYRPQPTE